MKRNFIKFTGIALVSTLAFTACHKEAVKEEPFLAALLAQAVKSAASGNCAISLNLGTLYNGAIIQAAVSTSTTFTQADYEAAAGKTIGAQNYGNYASVPYNLKYDAFIKGSDTYTKAMRDADIATGKATIDAGSILGYGAAICSANAATPGATIAALLNTWIATFSATEKTAFDNFLVAAGVGTGSATIVAGFNGAGCAAITNPAALQPAYTAFGGSTATAGLYQARQAYSNGTGILACARIPKSSCSFNGITTADRATAIASAVKATNLIANNIDCKKTDADFVNSTIRNSFTGVPKNVGISGFNFRPDFITNPNDLYIAISEGSTASSNKIFAESSYPSSAALTNLGTSFNVAFPLAEGTTKSTDATINYYKASNINILAVDSCESYGLGDTGPIVSAPTGAPSLAAKKTLTSTPEVAYAFSSENTAAGLYASVLSEKGGSTTLAVACNNSFRSKFPIPLAIGGGKLPALNDATSGDGASTSLLTACLYGGTATGRATSSSLLATTSLVNIPSCPQAASGAAAKFGDTGLQTLADFPNN